MTKRFWLSMLSITSAILTACTTAGAKENIEYQLSFSVGQIAAMRFKSATNVVCSEQNGEAGCLQTLKTGCRIWFSVDKTTGTITTWRYGGKPEDCWHYSPGY